jgi:hypothetical protein
MVKKKIMETSGPGVMERMPSTRKKEALYFALLAMTRLFLSQNMQIFPEIHPRFVQVMKDFLTQGFTNPDDIKPHIQRIEAFLTVNGISCLLKVET